MAGRYVSSVCRVPFVLSAEWRLSFFCLGDQGAAIVQMVLDHGKLRPPDILSRLSRDDPKSAFSPVPRCLLRDPNVGVFAQVLACMHSPCTNSCPNPISNHPPFSRTRHHGTNG